MTANGRYVSYLRVSTMRQGISGLGLEAQRATVATFLNGGSWEIVAEFVEVESGKADSRPELARALAHCRVTGSTLIVANVSRLTRSSSFLHRLLEAGVEVRFCDLPQIEGPTGRFLLTQMVAVAELEAGLIGERTKKALAAAKARGTKLGGDRGKFMEVRHLGIDRSVAVRKEKSDRRAADLAPIIRELQASGMTIAAIARTLTERGIPTSRGGRAWASQQVTNILARVPEPIPAQSPMKPVRRQLS